MPSTPAPLTRRLLAALETHAHEDSGPLALGDWPALASLFDRELALLTRLATATAQENAASDPELRARAGQLQSRYSRRARKLVTAAEGLQEERRSLSTARRHTRAVRTAYAAA